LPRLSASAHSAPFDLRIGEAGPAQRLDLLGREEARQGDEPVAAIGFDLLGGEAVRHDVPP
jgi:hypothetical protein